MRKKIIAIVLATLTLVTLNSNISKAAEVDTSYYNNYNLSIVYGSYREEIVIDNPDYQLWKDAFKPYRGQISKNDYSYMISFEDDVTEEDRLYTYCCMDNIPLKVTNYLIENGWKIEVTNKLIPWKDGKSFVSAYTSFPEHKIYLSNSQISHDIRISLTHEIGHVVSLQMLYDEIYDANYFRVNSLDNLYFPDNCCTNYICNSYVESLAQSFYEYLYYPFETAEVVPGLYNIYFSNLQ